MISSSKSPVLSTLPIEIIAQVLRQLDDINSLKQAILAGKIFYTAYQQFLDITSVVWENVVSSDLLQWTIAALVTGPKRRRWLDFVHPWHGLQRFLQDQDTFTKQTLINLPMTAYGELSRLHNVISHHHNSFVDSAILQIAHGDSQQYLKDFPLSTEENNRIFRAFYRLQVFCNVFRFAKTTPSTFQKLSSFFDSESPWVNEQLVIVHRFFTRQVGQFTEIIPKLNQIRIIQTSFTSDPSWGYISQELKYAGPDYMHLFNRAKSPLALAKKVIKVYTQYGLDLLEVLDTDSSLESRYLFEYSLEDVESMKRSSAQCDSNSGPFEAWFALHTFQRHAKLYGLFEMMHPHDMGYVMWDNSRLQRDGLIDKLQERWEREDVFRPMNDGRIKDFPLVTRYPRWLQGLQVHDWHGLGSPPLLAG